MHVDGSSNPLGAGAEVVLEGPGNVLIEQSLRFTFKTSNNQAEYEAIIAGLNLGRDDGACKLLCKTDSKLTIGHLNGEYQIKMHREEIHHVSSPWPFSKWGMDIIGPFAPGKGQVKFLLVAVDYSKWIEAEPLATITANQVQRFVWKNIICRYGIPHTIITDNGRQFIDKGLSDFYRNLNITHILSSVEHPQTNGQAKAGNKIILGQLKKRLDGAKGKWRDELLEVLWAYRCTPQSSTHEAPYTLVYGTDAVILVEVGEPSVRQQHHDTQLNADCMATHLDLLCETREKARIRDLVTKLRAARRYNSKLKPRSFHKGDLVWRMASKARKHEGKFSPNWEGPFRVLKEVGNGAYRLEKLSGEPLPNTWNISHLKFYFS